MKTELILKFGFEASHSLTDYEIPHPHLWRLEVSLTGQPIEGRIADIPILRNQIQLLVDELSTTYLNDNSKVSANVREFPTCETLSEFFYQKLNALLQKQFCQKNPTIQLVSVMIAILNMENEEQGAVKLHLS